jgi:transcription elongation factor Elf1
MHLILTEGGVHMSAVDVKCPICGTVNRSLDLDETDGWMECEKCGNTTQLMKYVKSRPVPLYRRKDVQVLIPLSRK